MSLVLTNAFRLEVSSLEAAFDYLQPWRAKIQSKGKAKDAQLHARHATLLIDRAATQHLRKGETTPIPSNPLGEVSVEISNRRKEIASNGYRDPDVDFDFSVTLFPYDSKIYGMIHTEQSTWMEMLLGDPNVHHKQYWDNTDGCDTVSKKQWEERGKIWAKILSRDPYRRPGYCGMTLNMTPFTGFQDVHEVVKAQPEFNLRLEAMSKEAMRHDFLLKTNTLGDMSRIFAQLGRFDDFCRSDPGQAALLPFKDACASVMSEELTKADFLGE